MNYDRNGVLVTTSRPKPTLRKCTRVVTIDSRDRDTAKFVKVVGGASSSDPGDYIVYLPRVFSNVTSIRLKNATIQGLAYTDMYVLLGLEGLNRIDETAPGADRSGYVDSVFAKIPWTSIPPVMTGAITSVSVSGTAITYNTYSPHNLYPTQPITTYGFVNNLGYNLSGVVVASTPTTNSFTVTSSVTGTDESGFFIVPPTLYYNDGFADEQVTRYNPPIGSLDRLHLTLRRHTSRAPITLGAAENSFTFEIEYLDNVFDDSSAFETRLG
jgi:hypothetical protein